MLGLEQFFCIIYSNGGRIGFDYTREYLLKQLRISLTPATYLECLNIIQVTMLLVQCNALLVGMFKTGQLVQLRA